jgi:hypothetical protein
MIRIEVPDSELVNALEKKKAGWLKSAEQKLKKARQAGKIGDQDGIWSEIKEVFILLQEFKCIYCEFPMPKVESTSADKVAVDYDVEHYRPKNRVTPWPTPGVIVRRPAVQAYQSLVASGAPAGYLRLAFDPFNYVVSCKVCNSSYKSDRFPIYGKPDSRSRKRASLDSTEKPLLLFPFGENGDDPDEYLSFDGPTVGHRSGSSYEDLRSQVVVDFFELDTREDLLEQRCMLIQLLWTQLECRMSGDPEEKSSAEDYLKVIEEEHRFPHTACGRAFIELHGRDRSRAKTWYKVAVQYLTSKDPAVFKLI